MTRTAFLASLLPSLFGAKKACLSQYYERHPDLGRKLYEAVHDKCMSTDFTSVSVWNATWRDVKPLDREAWTDIALELLKEVDGGR